MGPLDGHEEALSPPEYVLVGPDIDASALEAVGWVDSGELEGEHRVYRRAEAS